MDDSLTRVVGTPADVCRRDMVVVTDERGREHPGVVLRPHRSDGEYGSPESHSGVAGRIK